MMENPKELKQRLQSLAEIRSGFERSWQDVVDYVLPFRSDIQGKQQAGRKKNVAYDATATQALMLLSAALHGMLTNPSVPWFALRLSNPDLNADDRVVEWLQEVERRLYFILAKSNFNTEIHETYIDLIGYGSSVLYCGEHPETIMFFDNRELRECYLAENEYGQIDTVIRRFWMTARQMKRMWPDKISDEVKFAAEKKPDQEFEVVHAVFPREKYNPDKKTANNLPIASIYFEYKSEQVLSIGGYHEMPYLVPRWIVSSGEIYGRGPAQLAMPDIKLLNKIVETTIRAAQKQVDPPLLLTHDAFVQPIRLTPGGVNIIRGDSVADKMASFPMIGKLELGLEMEEQKRNQIRNIFFIDILRLIDNQYMTATEVMVRTEERLRILGPVLGRLQSELLKPLIDRVFGIAWRAGIFPEPPVNLQGMELDIEYLSPLARAQKAADVGILWQFVSMLGQMAQFNPQVIKILDYERMLRYIADVQGIPQIALVDKEKFAEMLAQEAETAQQQQIVEGLAQAADIVPKLSKTVEPRSPLDMLAGGVGLGGEA